VTMRQKPPRAILSEVRQLAQIARELSEGENFSITRLTTLKSLSEDPEVAMGSPCPASEASTWIGDERAGPSSSTPVRSCEPSSGGPPLTGARCSACRDAWVTSV
jgi:hypothetical protein